jgi:uncharacterized protein (DUF427 family)
MAIRMSTTLKRLNTELRYEPVVQRIRVSLGEHVVADTTDAILVWEPRRIVPSYAVPREALDAEVIELDVPPDDPAGAPPVLPPGRFAPHLSDGTVVSLKVGTIVLDEIGFAFSDPDLSGHVLLSWDPFTWVEETTTMTGHPHDPFKRITTRTSDRHVVVSYDGQVLADSRRAVLLLETSLPPRWYLPLEDVRVDLLTPSTHHSICAYKGQASYFSLTGRDDAHDIAWFYPEPLDDARPVKDLVCFWSEWTDLTLDGLAVPRPHSPFSRD